MSSQASHEIAATAARIVVEEGMEYGPAKRRAAKQLGLTGRGDLPDNTLVEDEVFEYLALFCAETQPEELRALRELAAEWMARLAEFRPHLCGAVWRGTATRLNDIHLQLYCDDSKSAEIALLNQGIDYDVGSAPGPRGQPVDRLSLSIPCKALNEAIGLHLTILDADDLRGALKPDARGRTERGDLAALRKLLDKAVTPPPGAPRQTGFAARRALLLLAGLSATAGGVWFGLKRHGQANTSEALSAPPGSSASQPVATASAADAGASAPLIQAEQLTAAFWQQQFDTPKGGQLSLAKAKGKPTLINFWATWCPPCVKEMPELDRFHREFTPKGWAVIGLAIDGPTPVKEFLAKVAVGFDLGLAGFGGTELAQALGNESGGLPFSVMIDAQGKVRHRKMGATHFEELATWARQIG